MIDARSFTYEVMNRIKLRDYVRKSMKYCTTYRIDNINQHMTQIVSLFPENIDTIRDLIAEEFPDHLKRFQMLLMLQ